MIFIPPPPSLPPVKYFSFNPHLYPCKPNGQIFGYVKLSGWGRQWVGMNTDVQEGACTFVGNTEMYRHILTDVGRQRILSDSDGAVSLRRCVQLNLWLNIQSLWRGVSVLLQF